jgi:hypothetical protein
LNNRQRGAKQRQRKASAFPGALTSWLGVPLVIVATVIGVISYSKYHRSHMLRKTTTANVIALTKGAHQYVLEPGIDYVATSDEARIGRVESVDGNWFAVSKSDGTIYRDCGKEPIEIAVAERPENSFYRVKLCGSSKRLTVIGR